MPLIKKGSAKKKKIIEDYNSTSSFYDKRYEKIQMQKFDLILKDFKYEYKTMIDAGCGTGLLFEYILFEKEQNKTLSYIGTDISWMMLKEFQKKLEKLQINVNLNLILSDLEYMPLRSNVFNSIVSFTSLQNLGNLKVGVNELMRIARNGAQFKISILKKNLNPKKFIKIVKSYIKDLEVKSIENMEDYLIQGTILKGSV
ncbi:MAG: class I SAM-dependent methyltransferase [Candidatus Thorarchaeota archaeon]